MNISVLAAVRLSVISESLCQKMIKFCFDFTFRWVYSDFPVDFRAFASSTKFFALED